MESSYYRALISAENKEQADKILDHILKKKIVAGGLIYHGPSRFWWKGEIAEMDYYNISTFIPGAKKDQLIAEVESVSVEEIPIIALTPIEGNHKFLNWIDDSTGTAYLR